MRPVKQVLARLALGAALLALAGCSDVSASPEALDGSATCARADPGCPGAAPSYVGTVAPILHATCVACHYPHSELARSSLLTYADVKLVYGSMLGQVAACLMPPVGPDAGQSPLTREDREILLAWLSCGAPDN